MTKNAKKIFDLTGKFKRMTNSEKRDFMREYSELIYEEKVNKAVFQLVAFDHMENGNDEFEYVLYIYPNGLGNDKSIEHKRSWKDLSQAMTETRKSINSLKELYGIAFIDVEQYELEVTSKAESIKTLIIKTLEGKVTTEEFYKEVEELKKWIEKQGDVNELVNTFNPSFSLTAYKDEIFMLFKDYDKNEGTGTFVASIAVTNPPIIGRRYHIHLCLLDFEMLFTK